MSFGDFMEWTADHAGRIIVVALVSWIVAIAAIWTAGTDSTDSGPWSRSRLRLHVDAATGCHYVSTIFGGPTPRLDDEGKQICSGAEE